MKIAVSGAHSTGKTTFLKAVRLRLDALNVDYQLVPDLALSCPLPILFRHTPESALWIVARGISEEISAISKSTLTLIDRPVIDAWAYLMASNHEYGNKDSPVLRTLVNSIESWVATYDIVYRTVINEGIPIDVKLGRYGDAIYRSKVGDCIEAACQRFTVVSRPLLSSDTSSEVDWLVAEIQSND